MVPWTPAALWPPALPCPQRQLGACRATSDAALQLTSRLLPRPCARAPRITLDGQEQIKALEGLRAWGCLLCAPSPATPSTWGAPHPALPPKQSRRIFSSFFQSYPRIPPGPGGLGLLLSCWLGIAKQEQAEPQPAALEWVRDPWGALPGQAPQHHSQGPFPGGKTEGWVAMGFSLSCCHPKRYLKQREIHKKLPAHFPPSP